MSAGVTFREARIADVAEIVRLVDSAYRGDDSRRGWTHEADVFEGARTDPGSVADHITDPNSLLLLAEQDREVVGCCHLERHEDHVYFGLFAIRPDRQRDGLGKVVLSEAEERARLLGVRQMRMTVLSVREELIAYYVRRGYRRTGELTPFPYDEVRFGVPKRADLMFELLVKDLAPPA